MEYVTLGRSGLKVSRVCLGAMNFGPAWGFGVDDAKARPIIDAFLDAGYNLIDTAGNYNDGQSEEIVGRAMRGKRESVVIARAIEAEILPVCAHHGLGILVWGPLGGGILAGRYHRGGDPQPDTRVGRLLASGDPRARQWASSQLTDRNLEIADEVGKVAAELDTTPAAVALAWVRSRPGVTSVIIGPRTVEQLAQNLTGFELELPAELASRLDEASGPAPAPVTGVTVPA